MNSYKNFLILIIIFLVIMGFSFACDIESKPTKAVKAVEISESKGTSVDQELEANAILWSEAKYHIGERTTVYGPVISTYYASTSNGKPTFLNIGKAHPDLGRFTVVIWGQNRNNFLQAPEVYYNGKFIYITGLITEYEGVPEIEVKHPSQIDN